MDKVKIIKFCDKTIEILILGVLALIPLYFNILTYISFEIDKIVLFRIFVEIALFFYLARTFILGRINIIKNKYFYLSLLFILSSQIIATFFSDNAHASFWGSYWRNFGVFTYIHFFVFSYFVFVYFDKIKLKNIFWIISSVGFISSLYALIQAFGFDFLPWQEVSNGYHLRPGSTLGQPNYLASYLLLILPAVVYLFFTTKNFYKKIILSFFFLFQFLAMILTYSRAAWIGFILAGFIYLSLYIYQKNKKYFFGLLVLLFLSLSLLVCINISGGLRVSPHEKLTVVSRLKSLANFNQGSGSSRMFYYSAAIGIIKNNPLLGHGLDNQGNYFYKYYTPEYAIYEKINRYPDKSHNEILDILITSGFLGLVAWMFLFFVFTKQGVDWLKNNQDQNDKLLASCLFFGLLSFYISIQFSFFTIVPAVYFWFYVAILFNVFNGKVQLINFQIKKIVSILFLVVFLFFTIFLIWNENIKVNIANHYYRKAEESIFLHKFDLSFAYFNKVLEYAPEEPYYKSQLAIEMLPIVSSLNKTEEKKFALDYLENILSNDKKQTTFEQRIYLASILSEKGKIKYDSGIKKEDIVEFVEADNMFRELTNEAPGFSFIFYYWGHLKFYQGGYVEALSEYYKAITMYPPLDHPEMNLEHRDYIIDEMIEAYMSMLDVKIKLKELSSAEALAKKALRLRPFDLSIWDRLNFVYFTSGDFESLEQSLAHLSMLYPDNENIKEFLKSVKNK